MPSESEPTSKAVELTPAASFRACERNRPAPTASRGARWRCRKTLVKFRFFWPQIPPRNLLLYGIVSKISCRGYDTVCTLYSMRYDTISGYDILNRFDSIQRMRHLTVGRLEVEIHFGGEAFRHTGSAALYVHVIRYWANAIRSGVGPTKQYSRMNLDD